MTLSPGRAPTLLQRLALAALLLGSWVGCRGEVERPGIEGGPRRQQAARTVLEIGAPVVGPLAQGQTVGFDLELGAQSFFRVAFDAEAVDLEVVALDPEGREMARAGALGDRWGAERLSAITASGGVHRLELSQLPTAEPRGSFRLELEEARDPRPGDRGEIEIERAFYRAQHLAESGSWDEALRHLGQLVDSAESAAEPWWKARALHLTGVGLTELDRLQPALSAFEASRTLWLELDEPARAAECLYEMADSLALLARYEEAQQRAGEALAVWRQLGARQHEAMTLLVEGYAYRRSGDYQRALESYLEALRLVRELGLQEREARSLVNVGAAYRSLGSPEKAIQRYEEALPILRSLEKRRDEAVTLNNIGWSYKVLDEPEKAVAYFEQALAIARELDIPRHQRAYLGNLGRVYLDLGRPRQALAVCRSAYELAAAADDIRGRAQPGLCMGRAHLQLDDLELADARLAEAVSLSRSIGDKSTLADSYVAWGRLRRRQGRLAEARELVESALEVVEAVHTTVDIQSMKASFLAFNRLYYELQIDLLMEEGLAAEALMTSERARARGLLELLGEAAAGLRAQVDPELLRQEREVREAINALALGAAEPSAAREIGRLLEQSEAIEARIRRDSPGYADLAYPRLLTLSEIQETVLDGDALLLEYSLGETVSWLWTVSRDGLRAFALAPRDEIEARARRVHGLLSRPAARQGAAAGRDLGPEAARLSELILAPAAELLDRRRLVVVPDGALNYLPFAALPKPPAAGRLRPLLLDHEVIVLPSASVVPAIRRAVAAGPRPDKMLLVLADPVFTADDPRLGNAIRTASTEIGAGTDGSGAPRAIVLSDQATDSWAGLRRLTHSRTEALAISATVPVASRRLLIGWDASREAVLSPEAARYRVLHFATHGLLDSHEPRLSGLVLSLFDGEGRGQDGVLRLHDIYDLRLGAELVVLSACATGLGKQVRGEGLIGLTRGFLHAGARSVVASLWNVEDEATAELMRRFYRGLFADGLSPAEALRRAQLELHRGEAGSSRTEAYSWAAFIVLGDPGHGPLGDPSAAVSGSKSIGAEASARTDHQSRGGRDR